jgi:hypothetical protein
MGEDTVVRFQKPESAHDAMMDLLRQGRNVPARPRQDGAVIVAIESYIAVNPTHGFDKLVPGGSGPGLWQMPPLSRVQSAAAEPEAQGQATPTSTREGTAHGARLCQRNLVGRLHSRCAVVGATVPHLQRAR